MIFVVFICILLIYSVLFVISCAHFFLCTVSDMFWLFVILFVVWLCYELPSLHVVWCVLLCKHESVYLAPIRFPKYSRQRRRPTSRGTTLQQKEKCGIVTTTFETDFHKITLDLTRQLLLLDTLFPLINIKFLTVKS